MFKDDDGHDRIQPILTSTPPWLRTKNDEHNEHKLNNIYNIKTNFNKLDKLIKIDLIETLKSTKQVLRTNDAKLRDILDEAKQSLLKSLNWETSEIIDHKYVMLDMGEELEDGFDEITDKHENSRLLKEIELILTKEHDYIRDLCDFSRKKLLNLEHDYTENDLHTFRHELVANSLDANQNAEKKIKTLFKKQRAQVKNKIETLNREMITKLDELNKYYAGLYETESKVKTLNVQFNTLAHKINMVEVNTYDEMMKILRARNSIIKNLIDNLALKLAPHAAPSAKIFPIGEMNNIKDGLNRPSFLKGFYENRLNSAEQGLKDELGYDEDLIGSPNPRRVEFLPVDEKEIELKGRLESDGNFFNILNQTLAEILIKNTSELDESVEDSTFETSNPVEESFDRSTDPSPMSENASNSSNTIDYEKSTSTEPIMESPASFVNQPIDERQIIDQLSKSELTLDDKESSNTTQEVDLTTDFNEQTDNSKIFYVDEDESHSESATQVDVHNISVTNELTTNGVGQDNVQFQTSIDATHVWDENNQHDTDANQIVDNLNFESDPVELGSINLAHLSNEHVISLANQNSSQSWNDSNSDRFEPILTLNATIEQHEQSNNSNNSFERASPQSASVINDIDSNPEASLPFYFKRNHVCVRMTQDDYEAYKQYLKNVRK